jgi:hypothetical protein
MFPLPRPLHGDECSFPKTTTAFSSSIATILFFPQLIRLDFMLYVCIQTSSSSLSSSSLLQQVDPSRPVLCEVERTLIRIAYGTRSQKWPAASKDEADTVMEEAVKEAVKEEPSEPAASASSSSLPPELPLVCQRLRDEPSAEEG